MNPKDTPQGKIAFEFASALVASEFERAHKMLIKSQQAERSPDSLKKEYADMLDYVESPANYIEVMNVLDEWPKKKKGDIGWAYAAIAGEDFSEAVAVVVCEEEGKHCIREIE